MIGKPWSPELLSPDLDYDILKPIFGPLHLGLYLHSGEIVRRGFAAPFDGVDLIDRHRLVRAVGELGVAPLLDTAALGPTRTPEITVLDGSRNPSAVVVSRT